MTNLKPLFLFCFLLFFGMLQAQTKFIKKSIYFDNAKFGLSEQGKLSIDSLLKAVGDDNIQRIMITGNTDNVGNPDFNKKLSEQRITATRDYLVTKGISDTLFKTNAFGETKPLTKNETEQDKQLNRRVDILVVYLPDTDDGPQSSICELYKQTEIKLQEFYIDNSRDTAIRSKSGTVIYIKANTFKTSGKCKDKRILFKMKDDFLASDMILDNLSTTSNGRIIETQGMIYTEAVDCNLKKVSISKGKDLLVYQPSGTIDPNAKIFTGNRTAHDSVMNWTLNTNSALKNFSIQELNCCYDYLMACRQGGCVKCKFFFCRITRIGEPFRGLFSKSAHQANVEFRKCQRSIRRGERAALKANRLAKRGARNNRPTQSIIDTTANVVVPAVTYNPNTITVPTSKCEELKMLYEKYKVDNNEALVYALNKVLLDSFQVKTLAQLQDTLNKLKVRQLELSYLNKSIAFEDYQYYVYNTSRLGWSNIDVFANMNSKELVKLKVDLKAAQNIDCKLVFKNRRFVIPASKEEKKYIFDKIPKGESVWIVALKYQGNQPMLCIKEIVTDKGTYTVEFKALTLEELKQELKVLDTH